MRNILIHYLKLIKGLSSQSRIISYSFKRHAAKAFLIHADENRVYTFSESQELAKKVIGLFSEKGLAPGDILAFSAPNCPEYFFVRAACHYCGIIFLGLPANLSEEAITHFLAISKAKIFFYERRADLQIDGIKAKAQGADCVEINSRLFTEITSQEAVPRFTRHSLRALSHTATLNVSSSTTQKIPKIVQLTDNNWVESLYGYLRNSEAPLSKENIFLCTVPFLTAGSTTFLPSLLAGLTHIMVKEDATAEGLVTHIKRYNVNRLYITPSRLLELLEWCKANDERLTSLKSIITGTEKFPALRLKEAINFFGPIITVGYGMVEALPPIAMLSPKDYHKLESAGRIARGVKVKITDDGRIALKCATVAGGYLDNADESTQCFRDGWFYSSDYGYIDTDNYLYILGRKEEMLTESPRRIFAKEVEDKLYTLTFINRCAALAKNAEVYIFVSLREAMESEQAKNGILRVFEENFKNTLSLKEIIVKENLPINAFGKLDRRKMREEMEN